jgi:hypothetical protein
MREDPFFRGANDVVSRYRKRPLAAVCPLFQEWPCNGGRQGAPQAMAVCRFFRLPGCMTDD